MATEVPSPILSVSLAAMASGREASCSVSLVQRPTKPRASAAREVSPTFRSYPPAVPRLASSYIYGMRMSFPVVLRASRSRWAWAASESG